MSEEKENFKFEEDDGAQTVTEKRVEVKKPSLYKVFLINDDFTPMEFVIFLLETVFHKSHEEATRLMLDVHTKGQGLCGVYPYDIARTKVFQVKELARKEEHPLECIMEQD